MHECTVLVGWGVREEGTGGRESMGARLAQRALLLPCPRACGILARGSVPGTAPTTTTTTAHTRTHMPSHTQRAAIRFVLNDAFTNMRAEERQQLLHVGAAGGQQQQQQQQRAPSLSPPFKSSFETPPGSCWQHAVSAGRALGLTGFDRAAPSMHVRAGTHPPARAS